MLRHAFGLIFLVLIHGSEVNRNFQCLYDFDGALMCEFTPEKLANCSKYKLNVEFSPDDPGPQRKYNCSLSNSGVSKCVFTIDIDPGLIYGENCTVTLKRNGHIEDKDIIDTKKNIKLKTPTIDSANTTSEGKTIVTWLTHYKSSASEELKTELQLKRVKAVNWEYNITENAIHKTHYEFYDLVPNTEYVVRARVCKPVNNEFLLSEWSKEKRFFSASSIDNDMIKEEVVPVLCLIVVLIVCTLVCCCVKIKKNWQSKDLFYPKIESIDNRVWREDRILCPEKTPTSKIEVFIPKQYMTEDKKSIATPSVSDSNSGNLVVSTKSSPTSADLGYHCLVRRPQNQVLEHPAIQPDMVRGCQLQSTLGMKLLDLPGGSDYKGVDMKESRKASAPISASHSDSGCISGSSGCISELSFDNLFYSALPSQCSGFVPSLFCDLDLACQSNEGFGQLVLKETGECDVVLPPLIQTELVYRPCAGLISEAECRPQALGVNEPCTASKDANRSLVKLMGQGMSINLNTKDVAQRLVYSKSLLHSCPFTLEECGLLQSDDEYRSVQSLISN